VEEKKPKILYAIQGTGNGHISRALELLPHFAKLCDVSVLISGASYNLKLPIDVDFKCNGLSFVFGKKGGIDFWRSYLKLNTKRLYKDIKNLPIKDFDFVISDFEPIASWAAKRNKVVCIGLSNQLACLSKQIIKPKKNDSFGKFILKKYAPCNVEYSIFYEQLEENMFTPIIRKKIRNTTISNEQHILVYLPSFSKAKIFKKLEKFNEYNFNIFNKETKIVQTIKNCTFFPIQDSLFIEKLSACNGVITNAGFGTTTESLFLNKKLLAVPMKNQYEQQCNAATLKSMGVTVLPNLKNKQMDKLSQWLKDGKSIAVDYPDNAENLVKIILNQNYFSKP